MDVTSALRQPFGFLSHCVLSVVASCSIFFGVALNSWAEMPPACLEVYIKSGAIPVGSNADWRELQYCKITASTGPVDLSTYYCTGTGSTQWINEYCGTDCMTPDDIDQCFSPPAPIPTPIPTPDTGAPECPSKPAAGNPILISTGNKYQEEVDYQGAGTLPLTLKRFYNSALDSWRFSGQDLLTISTSEVLWERSDGKGITFYPVGSLWEAADRPGLVLTRGADATWILALNTELRFIFNDIGQLQQSSNLNGESLTYHYSASGVLQAVVHSSGSTLTYGYDDSANIVSVNAPNSQEYRFEYENSNLRKVTFPDEKTRLYHYENVSFPHALTGITDENGIRYVTWQYDAAKRAISSVHVGGDELVTLAYGDNTTTVRNALGKEAIYHFTVLNQGMKLTAVEGQPSANCAAANKNLTYTPEGLLQTETDWQGVVTRFEYNNRRLMSRRIDAENSAQQRSMSIEWHPALNLPIKVIESEREIFYHYDAAGRLLHRSVTPRATP